MDIVERLRDRFVGWRENFDRDLKNEAADEIERLREASNSAYAERNKLVALLATLFPSGTKRTAIEGWDECWHGCVYIDFPWGQASWHYHDDDAYLFDALPHYHAEWNGHTTGDKYEAIIKALGEKE